MKVVCKKCNVDAINIKEGCSGDLVYAECPVCGVFSTGIGVTESHFDIVGKKKKHFSFSGIELVETITKASGNGAVAYVPKKWIGCRVAIVRLDEVSV